MRHYPFIFSLLLLFITTDSFAQKGTVSFQYNGQTFTLGKGDKIQLAQGTNSNGSFAFIERDQVIKKRESYSNSTTSKNTDVYTGQKEYLRAFYTNKTISIKKIKYYKKMDQYELFVFTTDGIYTLHIEEAINRGEVVAINGVPLGNQPSTGPVTGNKVSAATGDANGLDYILYLNNGSEIKCRVLEMKPNEQVKIETADKSVFVFKMEEIKELKKVEGQPLNYNYNNPSASTQQTANSFTLQTSPVNVKKDTTPLGYFYNTTEVSYFIPNTLEPKSSNSYSEYVLYDIVSGFGVRNMSGYVFKDYFFIGGGVGYSGYFEKDKKDYHALYFGFNQRLFALGEKKVSPTVSLHQNFGAIISGLSSTEGAISEYGFNFGARFALGETLFLTTTVGYSLQEFKADYLEIYDSFYQYYAQDAKVKAGYFSVNVAVSFKK